MVPTFCRFAPEFVFEALLGYILVDLAPPLAPNVYICIACYSLVIRMLNPFFQLTKLHAGSKSIHFGLLKVSNFLHMVREGGTLHRA